MRLPLRTTVATSCAAVLLTAGLAGCGSSSDKSNQASTPNQPDTSASQNPAPATSTAPSSDTAAGSTGAASSGNPFMDIRTAAQHMPGSAKVLAEGFSKALKLNGNSDSAAAYLRASLTNLFTDHVYLAGIAVATAYTAGADSDTFKTAAAQVSANATELETAVTGLVGDANGAKFKGAFDQHIADFVSYAVAAKGKDKAGEDKAVKSLTAYAATVGKFFNTVTAGALNAKTIQDATMMHILTLKKAVDDLASGSTAAYADLKKAADHMSGDAAAIAKGVAKAKKMDGDTADAASTLRSTLTSQLISHVYLAGVAVFTAYTDKDSVNGKAFKAAAAAVDENSKDVSSNIPAAKRAAFLESWRSHVGDFVDYAKADASKDDTAKGKAVEALKGYATASGDFLNKLTGGALPAQAVTDDLNMHISTLATAVDSFAAALVKKS
jgi:hypothetical protein